jgi:hypothetical protein
VATPLPAVPIGEPPSDAPPCWGALPAAPGDVPPVDVVPAPPIIIGASLGSLHDGAANKGSSPTNVDQIEALCITLE